MLDRAPAGDDNVADVVEDRAGVPCMVFTPRYPPLKPYHDVYRVLTRECISRCRAKISHRGLSSSLDGIFVKRGRVISSVTVDGDEEDEDARRGEERFGGNGFGLRNKQL